jgi:hypothetical protein
MNTRPLVLAALAAVSTSTMATENGHVRSLLGFVGQELTTPQQPGFYSQLGLQYYSADTLKDGKGKEVTAVPIALPPGLPLPPGATLTARVDAKVNSTVFAPRFVWITEQRIADGRLALALTLPIVQTEVKVKLRAQGLDALPLPPEVVGLIEGGVAQAAAAQSGKQSGLSDAEVTSFVDWQSDQSRLIAGMSLVVPTGDYDSSRVVNPGFGKFYTLRPLFAFSYVGENGLEGGAYTTYSINTRNSDTKVRSGQYLQSDWNVLYRLSDLYRVGLQGYVVAQTTNDRDAFGAIDDSKIRVAAIGPVVGYTSESGKFAADVKAMKEFGARNRPEGTTFWARLQMRFN